MFDSSSFRFSVALVDSMKSRGAIMTSRILALAAMFAAVLGVHAFHVLADCSDYIPGHSRGDFTADNHAEPNSCDHHGEKDSTPQSLLGEHRDAASLGSCPACDFLKTRPVQSCFGPGDLPQTHSPPSQLVVRPHTPISLRQALPRLSRAPPASFPMHIV